MFSKKWLQISLAWIICVNAAQAWWSTPHMLVAEIAYQNLDFDVRKRANALIATQNDEYDFVTAAVWADDIKDHGNLEYSAWHYVPLTFESLNDPMPTRADFPKDNHVSWAIEHEKSILKDPKASDVEKGLALRRLIHWVGDIHQPLHTATHVAPEYPNGDSGGNLFLVGGDPILINLHRLLDSGLGQWVDNKPRPLSDEDKRALTKEAKQLQKKAPRDLGSMDPYVWAIEHHALARAYGYADITYLDVPSEVYLERGEALTRAQVTLAGLRLAAILNEVLQKKR